MIARALCSPALPRKQNRIRSVPLRWLGGAPHGISSFNRNLNENRRPLLASSGADSAFRRLDKLQKGQHISGGPSVLFYFLYRQGEITSFSEEDAKDLSNPSNPLIIEAGPFEAHNIDTTNRVLPINNGVRWNIAA